MKSNIRRIVPIVMMALGGVMILSGLWSCEKIYDYEGDCAPHWQVKFRYAYNMKFADAFPGPMGVGSVHLYVYDAVTGRKVLDKKETAGMEGFSEDYVMPIEELPVGRYNFVAWCGLADNGTFTYPQAQDPLVYTAPATGLTDAALSGPAEDCRLAPLYYGRVENVDIYDEQGTHTVEVNLIKDTNEFTILLQHRKRAINPEDFEISIVDRNTSLLWNNGLAPDNGLYAYRPWLTERGTAVDAIVTLGEELVDNNILIWHLSTSRLIWRQDGESEPYLRIVDKRGGERKTIFEFPVLKYLVMEGDYRYLRDAHNKVYEWKDEQEYLDREDSWKMHFIMDENLSAQGGWYSFELHVLDWHKIFEEIDLGEERDTRAGKGKEVSGR